MDKLKCYISKIAILGFMIFLSNSNVYAQNARYWEIGLIGSYFYHLTTEDAAFPKVQSATDFNVDYIRVAYYGSPLKLLGFYSSINLGVGMIERGYPGWGGVDDYAKNQDFFIGTTFNPAKSKKFWFHSGLGVNRLVINGDDFESTGGGGGVTYIGGGIVGGAISNLNSPGEGGLKPYPEFSRVAPAFDIGLHRKLIGTFYMYASYKPIFTEPIRNDFNFGFSFVF